MVTGLGKSVLQRIPVLVIDWKSAKVEKQIRAA